MAVTRGQIINFWEQATHCVVILASSAAGLLPVFDPLAMRVLVGFRGLGGW